MLPDLKAATHTACSQMELEKPCRCRRSRFTAQSPSLLSFVVYSGKTLNVGRFLLWRVLFQSMGRVVPASLTQTPPIRSHERLTFATVAVVFIF